MQHCIAGRNEPRFSSYIACGLKVNNLRMRLTEPVGSKKNEIQVVAGSGELPHNEMHERNIEGLGPTVTTKDNRRGRDLQLLTEPRLNGERYNNMWHRGISPRRSVLGQLIGDVRVHISMGLTVTKNRMHYRLAGP